MMSHLFRILSSLIMRHLLHYLLVIGVTTKLRRQSRLKEVVQRIDNLIASTALELRVASTRGHERRPEVGYLRAKRTTEHAVGGTLVVSSRVDTWQ